MVDHRSPEHTVLSHHTSQPHSVIVKCCINDSHAFLWPQLPQKLKFRFFFHHFSPFTTPSFLSDSIFKSNSFWPFSFELYFPVYEVGGYSASPLLWFSFRENWRTKGFSVQVSVCQLLLRFFFFCTVYIWEYFTVSTLPFWKRVHCGVNEQWVWDKFCI